MAEESVARATIVLYNGAEQPVAAEMEILLEFRNGHGVQQTNWVKGPVIPLTLQYFDGPGDDYTFTLWVRGYRGTGDFIKADPTTHQMRRVMLIPLPTRLTFRPWVELQAGYPRAAEFLALGAPDEAAAEKRYDGLQKEKAAALACFLNLIAAMDGIGLGGGRTPLDFLKEIEWDQGFAQDRFYAYVDPAMIPLVVAGAADKEFTKEDNPGALHPGATLSYKQTEYPYSNVQLTFHEKAVDSKEIGGVRCVKFEPDMDAYKNVLDHGVLEVLPNLVTHGLTNPVDILSLRWLDTTDLYEAPFDPGYTLT